MAVEETLSDKDFSFIQTLVYNKTGIVIGDHKREMIYRRLTRRAKDLNLKKLSDYCDVLRSDNDGEMINFINAVTTNLTSFFRESHHFEFLSDSFFPDFIQSGKKRLRIWSSACSTGEEPYSIAITLYNALENRLGSIDAKILATDLDTQVINKAKSAVYSHDRIKDLSKPLKSKWFDATDSKKTNFSVDEKAKNLITFNKLNLLGPWPMKGKFDVIFCRNVLIYFDRETQENIVKRFMEVLEPGGILMLGHSESVLKGSTDFDSLGKTIYQRVS